MSVSSSDETIGKYEIDNRIAELEEEGEYDVVRLRNDEVLATFDNEEDAQKYIEDEDYNPERVVVRQQELDEDDRLELSRLQRLLSDVGDVDDFTLYRSDYFDAAWAKGEAVSELGRIDFDSWPLNLIDWDDAAVDRRDSYYEYSYDFDGSTYYSSE